MVSDAAPQMLSIVLCSGQTAIHLAVADPAGAEPQGQRWTLCGQPVGDRVSAQSFHRLGCSACAREAVGIGATSIADRRQAVNLPRFLAAQRESQG